MPTVMFMGFVNNYWIWIYLRTFYLIVFKKSTTNVRWLTIQQAFPAPVQLTEPSSIQFVSRPDPCSASLVIQSWIGFLAEYQTPGSFVRNRVINTLAADFREETDREHRDKVIIKRWSTVATWVLILWQINLFQHLY